MSKDATQRHKTAADLKADLQLYLDGKYPIVCPHTALKRGVQGISRLVDSHAKAIIMAALVGVAVAVLGIAAALSS